MKILLVVPDYPPMSSGGGGQVAKILAEGLQKNGNDVTVLAGYYNSAKRNRYQEMENGVKIIWLPLMNVFLRNIPQLIYSLPPRLSSLEFLLTFDYTRYDIIHLFAYPAHIFIDLIALISRNRNFILTIHAFPYYLSSGGPANSFLKLIYRIYLLIMNHYMDRNCKVITTISEQTRKDAINHNFSSEKIMVVPNGIYFKQLDTSDSIIFKNLGITKSDFLVTSIGRITWHKGFEYALIGIKNALKDVPNLKYVIIGEIIDHDYFMRLKEIVDNNHLNSDVIFTGYLAEDIKLNILSRSQIYLAPSLHEGFGLTLLEAMAYRIPIIATKTSGHCDVVKHMETAIMIETKNFENITSSIKQLYNNKDLQKKLADNGVRTAKSYDWHNIILKYEYNYKLFKLN